MLTVFFRSGGSKPERFVQLAGWRVRQADPQGHAVPAVAPSPRQLSPQEFGTHAATTTLGGYPHSGQPAITGAPAKVYNVVVPPERRTSTA